MSKTFEIDDEHIRRCPENHLSDDFLFPVAGRTEPGLTLAQGLCAGVEAETFLKGDASGLLGRFGNLKKAKMS